MGVYLTRDDEEEARREALLSDLERATLRRLAGLDATEIDPVSMWAACERMHPRGLVDRVFVNGAPRYRISEAGRAIVEGKNQ